MIKYLFFILVFAVSCIAWGDISYYESMKDYRNDRKKWEDWYLKNACTVEISYIDSVKVSLGLNY